MYVILNVAIYKDSLDETTPSTSEMVVDYVKFYALQDEVEVNPNGISLNQSTLSLSADNIGSSYELTATVLPNKAQNKTIIWTSSNELVAKVYGGIVQIISGGSCTITATTYNGLSASCNIEVSGSTVISDSFDRVNHSSSLGIADTGQTWTVLGATGCGITSNKAYSLSSFNLGANVVRQ